MQFSFPGLSALFRAAKFCINSSVRQSGLGRPSPAGPQQGALHTLGLIRLTAACRRVSWAPALSLGVSSPPFLSVASGVCLFPRVSNPFHAMWFEKEEIIKLQPCLVMPFFFSWQTMKNKTDSVIFNVFSSPNDSTNLFLCNFCFAECIVRGGVALLAVSPPQGAQNSQLFIKHDPDV